MNLLQVRELEAAARPFNCVEGTPRGEPLLSGPSSRSSEVVPPRSAVIGDAGKLGRPPEGVSCAIAMEAP